MLTALVAILALSLAISVTALDTVTPYTDRVIFTPPSNWPVPRTLYARSVLIANDGSDKNVLLATWENYSPEPPTVWFPVYRSTDLGQTWNQISNITDTQNGWGLRYQPNLFELPVQVGGFAVSLTILIHLVVLNSLNKFKFVLY